MSDDDVCRWKTRELGVHLSSPRLLCASPRLDVGEDGRSSWLMMARRRLLSRIRRAVFRRQFASLVGFSLDTRVLPNCWRESPLAPALNKMENSRTWMGARMGDVECAMGSVAHPAAT